MGVGMLGDLGVSSFDEDVYRQLLRDPTATVSDLAARLDARSDRIRAALTRLEDLGLATAGDNGKRAPVSPDGALDSLIHRREAELARVRAAKQSFMDEFALGRLQYKLSELFDVVTGTTAIYRFAREVYQGARHEILGFDQPPYAHPADFDEVATEAPVLARGATIKMIYSAEALQRPGRMQVVTELARAGEHARTLPSLPIKLKVFDRQVAIVPLIGDRHAAESVGVISESGILAGMVALFEAYWQIAHPIGSAAPEPELAGEERMVLTWLTAGMKDDAIARELGVSVRTVRRRVNRILNVLQASSRFQAGIAAARRDWS